MKRLLADWGLAIGVAVALIAGAAWWDRLQRPSGEAPPLRLVDTDGKERTLADFAGRPVVVNFWGTWCPPCRAEIPEFSAWSAAHPEVAVVGVAVRSGRGETLAKQAAALGATYTILVGDDAVTRDWAVDVFPTTYVLRADATIGAYARGAIDGNDLDALLAEASAAR